MVSAYVWALNTDLKLHHKETADLPRVHWSLLSYCSVGNKKIQNPNVNFLSWKPPKMSKNVFLTYFFHFKLIFSLFSATLEHIDKHIQYKSQVAASQHVKLKNNF